MEGLIDHLMAFNKINQTKLQGLKVDITKYMNLNFNMNMNFISNNIKILNMYIEIRPQNTDHFLTYSKLGFA